MLEEGRGWRRERYIERQTFIRYNNRYNNRYESDRVKSRYLLNRCRGASKNVGELLNCF